MKLASLLQLLRWKRFSRSINPGLNLSSAVRGKRHSRWSSIFRLVIFRLVTSFLKNFVCYDDAVMLNLAAIANPRPWPAATAEGDV